MQQNKMRIAATFATAAILAVAGIATFAAAASGGPSVTLSTTASSTSSSSTIPVSATFSENVSSFNAADITVTNGTVSNVATSTADTVFTFDVTPSADGDVTIQVPADATLSSASSTGNQASNTLTVTSDMTAPTISGVSVSGIGTTTATVNWTTSEPTTGSVSYGTTASYGNTTTLETTATTTHSAMINGLSASGTYHYQINVSDAAGNTASTTDATFATSAAADVAPVISGIGVTVNGTSSATIMWQTDIASTGSVSYGTTTSYGASTTPETTASTTHSATINGLQEATTYHFRITENNGTASASSSDQTFITSSTSSTTPLAIDGITTVTSSGVADNLFADGWQWTIHFTIPDNENALRIRFSDWGNASSSFPAAGNIRLSSPQSSNASTTNSGITETGNGYSDWLYLNGDTASSTAGRQVDLTVQVKIPFGTATGSYSSNFTASTFPSSATSTAP